MTRAAARPTPTREAPTARTMPAQRSTISYARWAAFSFLCGAVSARATDVVTHGGRVDWSAIASVGSLLVSAALAALVFRRTPVQVAKERLDLALERNGAAGHAAEAAYNWYTRTLECQGEQIDSLLGRCDVLEDRAETAEAALERERAECKRQLTELAREIHSLKAGLQ